MATNCAYTQDDLVCCPHCDQPMVPNLSQEDEDGVGWTCINVECPEGRHQFDEVESEDLVCLGVPPKIAALVVQLVEALAEEMAR